MAVNATTQETYDNTLIREDLSEQYNMLSPEETPFQTLCRDEVATATFTEWPLVELAATDGANRVIEGDDAPALDASTLGVRIGNYTQISDKVVSLSHTSQSVDAAGENIEKMTEQMAIKIREMKRDMEVMLMQNVAAVAGASGTARTTAGLGAWLRSNTVFETGGADPTLSGTTSGYPNAAATGGTTPDTFVEVDLNDAIESAWLEGGTPSVIMVNAGNKRVISQVFTGNATRYKDAIDKRLTASVDIYDSDFGELTVVPNRFQPTIAANNYAVYILDPEYLAIAWLEKTRQKPLAETGHAFKRLVWCEYALQVDNEAAHAIIRDTTNV